MCWIKNSLINEGKVKKKPSDTKAITQLLSVAQQCPVSLWTASTLESLPHNF